MLTIPFFFPLSLHDRLSDDGCWKAFQGELNFEVDFGLMDLVGRAHPTPTRALGSIVRKSTEFLLAFGALNFTWLCSIFRQVHPIRHLYEMRRTLARLLIYLLVYPGFEFFDLGRVLRQILRGEKKYSTLLACVLLGLCCLLLSYCLNHFINTRCPGNVVYNLIY